MSAYGAALRESDDYPEAELWLRRALDAGEPEAARLLARTLMESGRGDEAADVLSPLVDDGRNDLASLLGHIYDDLLDKPDEADRAYQAALTTGSVEVYNDYGVFLGGQERFAEAETMLRVAIERGDKLAPGNLVSVLVDDARLDEALLLALEYAGPEYPAVYSALAGVYVEMDDDALAHEAYERSIAVDAPQARTGFGEHLYESGEDLIRAELLLREAFDEYDEAGAGYVLACLLIDTGRRDEGIALLEHVESWGDPDATGKLRELGVN